MEGQVHGPEELLKLPGWLGVAAHQARLPNLRSIVYPDASQAGEHIFFFFFFFIIIIIIIIAAADPCPTTSMEASTASTAIRVRTN